LDCLENHAPHRIGIQAIRRMAVEIDRVSMDPGKAMIGAESEGK
jgi:hypothetical protein